MRALAITGTVTAALMPSIRAGSLMRATPPSRRMSAGTRSSAMTATAPASSAIFAWPASTTSMITPPRSMSASPRLTAMVPVVADIRSDGVVPAPAGTAFLGHGRSVPPGSRPGGGAAAPVAAARHALRARPA